MKKVKSVWDKVDTEKEPDVYKIIKEENIDNLINDELDLDEDDVWVDEDYY
jgi:hypothetical protein